jgi:hypothetical protein
LVLPFFFIRGGFVSGGFRFRFGDVLGFHLFGSWYMLV